MEKKFNKPILKARKLINQKGTLYMALTKEFVKLQCLRPGKYVPVLANHILKITHMRRNNMETDRWSLFKCQRCGQCCEKSGLPWDPNNIQKISEFLKMDSEDLVTRYYGDIYWENSERFIRWDKTRRKPCPFLGEDKNCQIYPVRPNGCKAYPIDTDFGRCGVDCPGMKILDAMDSSTEKSGDQPLDTIDLLFENPEEKGITHPPFAYICLGNYSRTTILGHEHIVLSAECTSYDEVKWWVGRLKKHLNNVLKEAKRKFAKANKKPGLRSKRSRNPTD